MKIRQESVHEGEDVHRECSQMHNAVSLHERVEDRKHKQWTNKLFNCVGGVQRSLQLTSFVM